MSESKSSTWKNFVTWLKQPGKRRRNIPADLQVSNNAFPNALASANLQYTMRQAPSRGIAELLQAYRSDYWLHRVVDIIGDKFASVNWLLYYRPDKKDPNKRRKSNKYEGMRGHVRHKGFTKAVDSGELKEIEDHPLLELLNNPNPQMSGMAFRSLCQKYLDLTGEVFILKVYDPTLGTPVQLWPLSTTWVFRVPTNEEPFFDLSILGRPLRVPAEYMIWMRHNEVLNPYARGSGMGEAIGSLVDTNHYALEFQKSFFYNDATPKMFIHMKGAAEDNIQLFQQSLENANRGPLRKHRPFIYDSDEPLDIQQMDVSSGMAAAVPLLDKIRDNFISCFGVPPEIAGVLANSNRATIDAAEDILARQTIMPRCEFWLDELSRQLVPEFDDRLLLAYENPVPEDKTFRLAVLKAAPWIAEASEWRELAGLPDRGTMDNFHMVPMGFTPTPDPSVPVVPAIVGPNGTLIPAVDDDSNPTGDPPAEEIDSGPPAGTGPTDDDSEADDETDPQAASKQLQESMGRLTKSLKKTSDDEAGYEDDVGEPDESARKILESLDASDLTDELDPLWRAKVKQVGNESLSEVDSSGDNTFNMPNPAVVAHLKEFSGTRITGMVNETTRQQLQDQLSEGFSNGEGIKELAERVQSVFDTADKSRAELIARTEVTRSSNFASLEGYKQSGIVTTKQWVATQDQDMRDSHAELGDMEPINVNDDFEIEGQKGQYPGSFGSAEMDCNCRCTIAPGVDPLNDVNNRDDSDSDEAGGTLEDEDTDKRAAYHQKVWKKFDAAATAWEKDAHAALRRGFAMQKSSVLKALNKQLQKP